MASRADGLPRGKVIERVVSTSNPAQSYALYLPSGYTPEKRYPIIYAFEPAARGPLPVNRFKDGAEKYGYIVAASNNSSNYVSPEEIKAAIVAIFDDTIKRLSIDENRVYTTGFSGGSRVASRVAIGFDGKIAGVIAVGAGFPPDLQPSGPLPFVYFSLVGNDDFNYIEMKRVKRQLDSAGVANRMEVFEGGHDWPPPLYCTRAIEWMELQAMKRGRRPKDEALIEEMIKKRLDEANAARAAARSYEEYGVYDAMAYDFRGLSDVTEFEKKAAELKETKEVKQALKQDRDMESEQQRRVNEIVALRRRLETSVPARLPNNEAFGDATETRVLVVSDLKRKIAELTKKARSAESSPERTLARRVVNQVLVWWYEDSMRYIQHKRYDLAVASLSLDAQVMPDNPRVLFRLATAHSLNNDKKRALETLKKAVEKGFNDVAELESNAALAPLRQDDEYKKIVDALGKSKT